MPPAKNLRQVCGDRKSTRLNSSHLVISYAVFCLKKKKRNQNTFCILDPTGKTRIVGKNHVARCPSCAEVGHDRSGVIFFFFNDTATTEIYTLSLHDALPI